MELTNNDIVIDLVDLSHAVDTALRSAAVGDLRIARGHMLDVKKQYDRVMRDMNELIEGKCNG